MYNNKIIHFIGIGGISMSGIAEIMLDKGAIITGSDMQNSKQVEELINKGAKIIIGSDSSLVEKADIIVYTAAIPKDNIELLKAKELNKEMHERAEFLGIISKEYDNVICIAGTHGKSTTTGMISSCFLKRENPTIQIGAFLPQINSNYYVGDKKYFIMEACEYVDSFLKFFPTTAIILNIDDDHLDYFGNLENVKKSFSKYAHLLPKNGNLILNADDKNTISINIPDNVNLLTYAIDNDANVTAQNINFDNMGHPEFDVVYNQKLFAHIKLNVLGRHNIYNALATITTCISYDIDKNCIIDGLEEYTGVERRFEYIGKYKNNVLVYDDYAHHPTEIKSTLDSAKKIKCNQNWVIFQSHTYSRTYEHMHEFAEVLSNFDNVIVAPIYPARETNIWNVKESELVSLIKKPKKALYIDSFDKIVSYLKENVQDGDLIITVGAGPVNQVGLKLLDKK